MGYSKNILAEIIKKLLGEGVEAVLIGDTCVQLALDHEILEGDLDLFVLNPSPLVERDFYMNIAERNKWGLSSTEIGTPALIIPTNEGDVVVELYENYMDIEIPFEILEDKIEYKIQGVKVQSLRPEHYIVLKARQGIDLDKLYKYINELKERRRLNIGIIKQVAYLYPEDDAELIISRLSSIGLEIE
ncbi:MAG: nucleotidyltransferase [Desulfurococcaceae archaeon]